MAFFGSDSKSTTEQLGIEGGGTIATDKSTVIYEFPETVASFANTLAGLAGSTVNAAVGLAQGTQDALGDVAKREKTPLTEWLPFIAIGAVGLVALVGAFVYWGQK